MHVVPASSSLVPPQDGTCKKGTSSIASDATARQCACSTPRYRREPLFPRPHLSPFACASPSHAESPHSQGGSNNRSSESIEIEIECPCVRVRCPAPLRLVYGEAKGWQTPKVELARLSLNCPTNCLCLKQYGDTPRKTLVSCPSHEVRRGGHGTNRKVRTKQSASLITHNQHLRCVTM